MVLTHLVQFKFVHGATVNEVVVAPTFGGFHPIGPYAFLGGFTVGDAPDAPTGQNDAVPRGRVPWLAELPGDRSRTREEISRDRERFGIVDELAAAAIAEVAARQAERGDQDEQKRFDELYRELELRRIAFDARYLEMLGALREQFIKEAAERQQRDEEEILILLMLAASL